MEKRLTLIVEKCSKNHVCPPVSVRPAMALEQDEYKAPTIDESKCICCGTCMEFCPKQALIIT